MSWDKGADNGWIEVPGFLYLFEFNISLPQLGDVGVMPPAPKLTGPLTENTRLRSAQQILKTKFIKLPSFTIGYEVTPNIGALAWWGNFITNFHQLTQCELYTGLANGRIVRIEGKVITEIGYTGKSHAGKRRKRRFSCAKKCISVQKVAGSNLAWARMGKFKVC
eukprot:sb/3472557/